MLTSGFAQDGNIGSFLCLIHPNIAVFDDFGNENRLNISKRCDILRYDKIGGSW